MSTHTCNIEHAISYRFEIFQLMFRHFDLKIQKSTEYTEFNSYALSLLLFFLYIL